MSGSPLAVRHAAGPDLHAVLDVHSAHGSRPEGPATERELATWERMAAIDGLHVYVAEHAGAVVGTASTMMMPNLTYDCAPTLFIEAVVVVPTRRREGIATRLLAAVLAEAKSAGCHKVQLLSHKRHAQDGAHDLYRQAGFDAEAEGFRLYVT
jgi:GNAT superfamily N-acetyltransferase